MYNGWLNYETWNVALWIGNDEGLYDLARECDTYSDFVERMREIGEDCGMAAPAGFGMAAIYIETPDKVAWNDSGLDIPALDEMIREL